MRGLIALAAAMLSATANAQAVNRISGSVAAYDGGAPIVAAEVRLTHLRIETPSATADSGRPMWATDGEPRLSLTDSAGRFDLIDVEPGPYLLVVRRIGFAPLSARLQFAGGTFDTYIPLQTAKNTLAPVVVSASVEQQILDRAGFSERLRAKSTNAHFLGPENIENQMRARGLMRKVSPNSCSAFYIDGLCVRDLAGLMPGTVVGVEMYGDQFDAPSKFPNPVDSRCPVILFWTKVGIFALP